MSLLLSGDLRLRKTWQPMDPDAAAYITAVETADDQALEQKTKIAIDNFVLGCKADGVWDAIKASCILAGARTLAGALVPLVGATPTNFNFVSGDYNRKMGLVGDGSTKYLNSNRNNNADPQDSKHVSVFPTVATIGGNLANSGAPGIAGRTGFAIQSSTLQTSCNSLDPFAPSGNILNASENNKLIGVSRSASQNYNILAKAVTTNVALSSTTPNSGSITIFARPASTVDNFSPARLAFYSIGEALDLALLDARVTDLINAFGAAIP